MLIPFIPIIEVLVIAGLIYWVITLLPLPEPFPTIIRVVVIIAVVVYLLRLLGVGL